jgi:hypothetical protein
LARQEARKLAARPVALLDQARQERLAAAMAAWKL